MGPITGLTVEFSRMLFSTHLSALRSVSVLVDGDLYDLAQFQLRVFDALKASGRTSGTRILTPRGLVTEFVTLFPEFARWEVEEKLEGAGISLDDMIVWDEDTSFWEREVVTLPPEFDPNWRSETVVAIATGILADRAFDRLPILADALEEAGCDDAKLLADCRNSNPSRIHGYRVVELVLGIE